MSHQPIAVAVILAAGKGTRVMPLSLHQPKAMIGIVDRPILHYVVDEIMAAAISEVVIVYSKGQEALRQYISHMQLSEWKDMRFHFVLQSKAIGNADAVYRARNYIGDRPFALLFGDDINYPSPLNSMIRAYALADTPILFLEKVPWKEVHQYGVVKTVKGPNALFAITDLVEKPVREKAPSNISIIGRYILTPDILKEIKKLYRTRREGKELLLTDAFANYLAHGGLMHGWLNDGKRFDCGSKSGILKAQVFFGLKHKEFGKEFKKYLKKV